MEWVFVKYEGGSVSASKPVVVDMEQHDIARIIGRIVALLRQCKDDVNPGCPESRQERHKVCDAGLCSPESKCGKYGRSWSKTLALVFRKRSMESSL
jgi:hypothetical protein